jgi:hypothetical protein
MYFSSKFLILAKGCNSFPSLICRNVILFPSSCIWKYVLDFNQNFNWLFSKNVNYAYPNTNFNSCGNFLVHVDGQILSTGALIPRLFNGNCSDTGFTAMTMVPISYL